MNPRSDTDGLLRHWFEDGPTTMPDRVVDVVADRIGRQAQRRSWRLRGRPFMNTYVKVAAGLAAAVIIAFASWQFLPSNSSLGGLPSPSPSPSPSPTVSAAPAEDPSWWLAGTEGPCGEAPVPHGCAGPLLAGTYTSGGLQPAVTYTVPADWVNVRDWATYFQIFPDTPANRTALTTFGGDPTTQIVIRPLIDAIEPCEGQTAAPGPLDATGIAAAARARYGAVSDPTPTTVGDLSGYQVDLTAIFDLPIACPETTMAPDGGGHRLIVLDGPAGTVIAITLDAPTSAELDAFLTLATPIVNSITFATE